MPSRRVFLLILAPLVFLSSGASPAQPPPEVVTRWGIWETSLTTAEDHAWNSFPVQFVFTHASGAAITLDGFFDGAAPTGEYAWRVRFTPTLAGTWQWQSVSAVDAALDNQTGRLWANEPTAEELAGNPNYRGHLRVATGPRAGRYLTYADGTPFFWLGDTAWHLNTRRSGIDNGGGYPNGNFYTYLDDRAAKGFTVIQAQLYALDHQNEAGFPFYADAPCAGQAPSGDFSRLCAAFFQNLDARVSAVSARGLVLAAHPAWFPDAAMTVAQAQDVSRYLLARYSAYNLVWSLSGEYSYKYPGTNTVDPAPWALCWDYAGDSANSACEWNQLGEYVAQHNAYAHPLTIHPSGRQGLDDPPEWGARAHELSSGGEFHEQPWLALNWTQTGQITARLRNVYTAVVRDYNRLPVKPTLHAEGYYENANAEGATAAQIRWQAWTALLNGAAGHTYGAAGVWQFYDPNDPEGETGAAPHDGTPWRAALDYEGAGQMRHVRSLLTSLEWWRLEPHREWLSVDGAAPSAPGRDDLTPPHLAAIRGEVYVVYLPPGNAGRTIRVTSLDNQPYRARWYNPRTGLYMDITSAPHGATAWTIPNRPASDPDNDWVLVLKASADPIPALGQ